MKKKREFNLAIFISTFFYAGLFPYAPGTVGSICGFVIYVFLFRYLNPYEYALACLFIFAVGVYYASESERLLGFKDPPQVVIDEVLGYLLTMAGGFYAGYSLVYALVGLGFFRFFDILKPFPVRYIDEKMTGGIGIMLDDVAAAVFSAIILMLVIAMVAGI